jgi:hypothetical protein
MIQEGMVMIQEGMVMIQEGMVNIINIIIDRQINKLLKLFYPF